MSAPRETFQELLRQHGYSVTRVRLLVFGLFLNREPMTMHAVIGQARSIDRASVYRTVDLFEKLGIIQRLTTGWKYKLELTDIFTGHHHHLTCLDCGSTQPINEQ